MAVVASIGESARLAPSSVFYVVSSAILSCKSFEIRVNLMMISLKIYKIIAGASEQGGQGGRPPPQFFENFTYFP